MRYLSVCSGIEAASAAWHDLGWTPVAFSEIEPFPSAVLAQRFPSVPNWGDMTKFKEWPDADVDVLVGGTPCQSFSVAGLRRGLDDPRGSLMLTFLGIAARYRPRYVVWENVPGVLSSGGGRDFGSFLGALGELGYGWAYRVLDAQWFGVAQRRRRVFVVGCAGDQRRAAQVLFERESVCRHPAPRREAGQRPAPSLAARTQGGGGLGTDAELDGALIPAVCPTLRAGGNRTGGDRPLGTDVDTADSLIPEIAAFGGNNTAGPIDVATACNAHGGPHGRLDFESETFVAHSLRAEGFDASEDGTGRGTPLVPVAFHPTQDPISSTDGTTHAMGTGSKGGVATQAGGGGNDTSFRGKSRSYVTDPPGRTRALVANKTLAVAFSAKDHGADAGELAPTLRAMGHGASHANGGGQVAVATAMQVRRLTPRECERLQGFPDDWTLIPWRGRPAAECPDGPRYKALGNSMAVPCMRWIGQRIAATEALRKSQ